MSFLDGKSILVTGATGSFGKRFVRTVETFQYSSDTNRDWMTREELGALLAQEVIEP